MDAYHADDMTYDRLQTNEYRNDRSFRMKLMNTAYLLRFVKIPLVKAETGETYDEILLTNLTPDESPLDGLKELYRLRWEIESAYNVLKNKMKLAEFSSVRERFILQDTYCCVWLYNLTMLLIIESNEAQHQYLHRSGQDVFPQVTDESHKTGA